MKIYVASCGAINQDKTKVRILEPVGRYDWPETLQPQRTPIPADIQEENWDWAAAIVDQHISINDVFLLCRSDMSSRVAKVDNQALLLALMPNVQRLTYGNKMFIKAAEAVSYFHPTFVFEISPKGPIKLHTYWVHAHELRSNLIYIHHFGPVMEENAMSRRLWGPEPDWTMLSFQRREIGWKKSFSALRAMSAEEIRAWVKPFFMEKVNPRLKHAILTGEDDPLLTPEDLKLARGTETELQEILQAAITVGHQTRNEGRLWLTASYKGRPATAWSALTSGRQPDHPRGSTSFVCQYVIPHFEPTGMRWIYDDSGPTTCKEGYRENGIQRYAEVTLAPTGHETTASLRRLTQFLVATGLTEDEAKAAIDHHFIIND